MKAKQINELKLPLEAKLTNKIYRVLKNQAEDVEKFYLTVNDIAINYKPEIIKEIRDGMRMAIAIFGYAMRSEIERDLDIKFKSIDDLEEANKQLELDFALFIANEGENQANLITASSNNEIKEVIARQTQIKAEEISVLIREQNELLASGGDKKRIATIEKIIRNAKNDIAKNIKIKYPLTFVKGYDQPTLVRIDHYPILQEQLLLHLEATHSLTLLGFALGVWLTQQQRIL